MSYAAQRASRSSKLRNNKMELGETAKFTSKAKERFTLISPAGNQVHYYIFTDKVIVTTIKSGYWYNKNVARVDYKQRMDAGYKRIA